MPLKWKIFFALNIVLGLPAVIFFIYGALKTISFSRGADVFSLLFLAALLLIILNSFLNVYLLQRFFPDKHIPEGLVNMNTFSLVLNWLLCAGYLVLCIYITVDVFGDHYRILSGQMAALAIFYLIWLVQLAVLVMQGQLPGLISRNNYEKMNLLIDSIGDDRENAS